MSKKLLYMITMYVHGSAYYTMTNLSLRRHTEQVLICIWRAYLRLTSFVTLFEIASLPWSCGILLKLKFFIIACWLTWPVSLWKGMQLDPFTRWQIKEITVFLCRVSIGKIYIWRSKKNENTITSCSCCYPSSTNWKSWLATLPGFWVKYGLSCVIAKFKV